LLIGKNREKKKMRRKKKREREEEEGKLKPSSFKIMDPPLDKMDLKNRTFLHFRKIYIPPH
jgi:hypothetical protein